MASIAVSEDVTLSLPNTDLSFLRTLSKKMGWTMRRHRKTGIEKGLEDIRKGNVFHAKNSEDLIKQILSTTPTPPSCVPSVASEQARVP